MYKAFYATAELLDLPIVAMLAFMGVFAAVAIRQWTRGAKNPEQEKMSLLPFVEEEPVKGGHS